MYERRIKDWCHHGFIDLYEFVTQTGSLEAKSIHPYNTDYLINRNVENKWSKERKTTRKTTAYRIESNNKCGPLKQENIVVN